MATQDTVKKVKELLEGHCYAPLKEAAEKWIDEVGKFMDENEDKAVNVAEKVGDFAGNVGEKAEAATAKILESELVEKLKEGIATADEMIDHFSTEEAKKQFGEMADKIKKHGEELKAKGEKFCDCDACKKAREILKDLGEKLD